MDRALPLGLEHASGRSNVGLSLPFRLLARRLAETLRLHNKPAAKDTLVVDTLATANSLHDSAGSF